MATTTASYAACTFPSWTEWGSSSIDSVTPTEQSIELFKHAGSPTELHLFAETDHFMLAEDNVRVLALVREWLARYLPAS